MVNLELLKNVDKTGKNVLIYSKILFSMMLFLMALTIWNFLNPTIPSLTNFLMIGQFLAFLGILRNRIVPQIYLDPSVLIGFNLAFNGIIGFGYFLTLGQGIRFVPQAELLLFAAFLNFLSLVVLYFLSLVYRVNHGVLLEEEKTNNSPRIGTLGTSSIYYLIFIYLVGSVSRISTIASGRYFHIVSDETLNYSTASSGIVEIMSNLPLIVTVYLYLRLTRKPFVIHLLWLIEVPYALLSGTRQDFLQIAFAIFCVVALGKKRKVNKSNLTKLSLFFSIILVFPLLQNYRSFAKYQSDPINNIINAISEVTSNVLASITLGIRLIAERASDLISISRGLDRVNSGSDLLKNGTHEMLINSLIPRFMIPDKFDLGRIGNDFGRNIGISTDRITSITFPPSLEGYAQGKFLGAFIVCFLYSLLIIWFGFLVRRSFLRFNLVFMAAYIATAIDLYNSLGNVLALGLIGYMKGLFIWYLILAPLLIFRSKDELKISK